jgi:hypothetical protein
MKVGLGWKITRVFCLKVHKIEIFLTPILEFVLFLLIGPLLGEVRFFRVVLRLRGMKKNFEIGQKFFYFFFIYEPFI